MTARKKFGRPRGTRHSLGGALPLTPSSAHGNLLARTQPRMSKFSFLVAFIVCSDTNWILTIVW